MRFGPGDERGRGRRWRTGGGCREAASSVARGWWWSLQPDAATRRPGERAALSRLRRATPLDAAMQEATLRLFRALRRVRPDLSRDHLPRVATLASLLAQIREDDRRTPFGRAIGRSNFDKADSAALKPLRFERLVVADGEEEIARAFRRAIAILRGRVHVADLARIVLAFDDEKTRRDLAFDYFGAGFAAPDRADAPLADTDAHAEAAAP
jgi:CRISPR system Cascade subunit CasB